MTPTEEARAVSALVALWSRLGTEERADLLPAGPEPGDDAEGLRIAADHGIDPMRLSAFRSLARSRNLALDQVLRAAFRGELREVVELPAVRP